MVTRLEAESRVKLVYWAHLAVYVLVITGLAILNYTQTPHKLWAVWVAAGWGAGIVLHGALIYFTVTRERAINRTIARMNHRAKK